MASISPSTWGSAPTSVASTYSSSVVTSYGAKISSFAPRRFNSRGVVSASSSEDGAFAGEAEVSDRVRLAFSKAKDYRKVKKSLPEAPVNAQKPSMELTAEAQESGVSELKVPIPIKLAMEKAKENQKNKQVSALEPRDSGEEVMSLRNSRKDWIESELNKKDVLKITSKDFLGLDFSEKKSYSGKPPGLVPLVGGPLLDGDVPEVEIIVGDASKFEKTPRASASFEVVDTTILYKPKVSTWGVFPRPNNISKTFGGGRVIESGEKLETPKAREANENHSRELILAYKKKMGLTADVMTRAECEKALMEGDNLMDRGQLREALPYYEKVMKSLVFQSDLHGLAALQWSICQDSLSRPKEARIMYEKLKSHPNAEVSKKARQFIFSFQAMEMMKMKDTSLPIKTGYEDYFEAFVDNKASYTSSIEEQNERMLEQFFLYLIFLLSPVLIILFVVVKKSF